MGELVGDGGMGGEGEGGRGREGMGKFADIT